MAGAFLATHLTGNEYVFQAGAAFFGVKDGPRGRDDVDFAMIPEASGYNGYEFHAWFVRRPRGVGNGEVCRGNEFVDLSLRHIPALVVSPMILGEPVEWKRTNWPDFFWGRLRELTALKIRLHPDRRVMENVGNKHDMKLAAQVAQTRLGNHRKKPSTTAANRVSEDSQRQWDDCYSAG
jgi:hypothetical protein